jgi:ribose transport system permease protein
MSAVINSERTASKSAFEFKPLAQRYSTLLVMVLVAIVFGVMSDRFVTVNNLLNILQQISMLTIVAVGLTYGFSVREMDLSVGFTAALGGLVVPLSLLAGHSLTASLLFGLCVGLVVGVCNTLLVVWIGVPSLIATIAVGEILFGVNFVLTDGRAVYGSLPDNYLFLGQGQLLGIPNPALAMIAVVGISWIVLQRTVFGRHLYAVGGNARAAELSGINVAIFRSAGLIVSALLATVAGIVLSARLGSGQPTAGDTYLLDGLAAVFIGMTMLRPGTSTILGTFFGALLIGIMNNGLNLLGVDTYFQSIVKGAIIVLAVAIVSRTTKIKLT